MKGKNSHITQMDDDYATCERTCAELRIYGDDLDPGDITTRLRVKPSGNQMKGQEFRNSIGRVRIAKTGAWFLSSENHVDSKDLRRHLDWLLDKITPAKDVILDLQRQEGVTMDVTCIWWSACGHGGPTLWPEQMRLLGELNLECGFELAFFGEEEEQ